MLAAAVADRDGTHFSVLDVGAGVGTAGLCVAWRCARARVVLIEREPELVALARENVDRNGLADRVAVIEADIGQAPGAALAAAGLTDGTFDQVIANPPYHLEGAGTAAASALKAAAHAMPEAGLETWVRFLARMARPGGEALIVHKASALPELLAHTEGRFGDLSALPLQPFADQPAGRVLLRGTKGSRAPFRLEAGLVIHEAPNRFTAGAERVLRFGQSLAAAYGKPPEAGAA